MDAKKSELENKVESNARNCIENKGNYYGLERLDGTYCLYRGFCPKKEVFDIRRLPKCRMKDGSIY